MYILVALFVVVININEIPGIIKMILWIIGGEWEYLEVWQRNILKQI